MACSVDGTHIPVLKEEIRHFLSFPNNTIYVDGTLGLGGHFTDFLETIPSISIAVGIDMDSAHLQFAKERTKNFESSKTLYFVHDAFAHMKQQLEELQLSGKVTSILVDFGICSTHVDTDARGFSFQGNGPLDMRFDISKGITAADIINTFSKEELADIFWNYGEEKKSRIIAQKIIERRKEKLFDETKDLADFIKEQLYTKEKKHPATRIFQALRIAVNNELSQISTLLHDILDILSPGGRIACISYHSLEDRLVKHAFKEYAKTCTCPTTHPICTCSGIARMNILTKKPIVPSSREIELNPRSRSAKLRIAEKI